MRKPVQRKTKEADMIQRLQVCSLRRVPLDTGVWLWRGWLGQSILTALAVTSSAWAQQQGIPLPPDIFSADSPKVRAEKDAACQKTLEEQKRAANEKFTQDVLANRGNASGQIKARDKYDKAVMADLEQSKQCRMLTGRVTQNEVRGGAGAAGSRPGAAQDGPRLPAMKGQTEYNGVTIFVSIPKDYLVNQVIQTDVTSRGGNKPFGRAGGTIKSGSLFEINQLWYVDGTWVRLERPILVGIGPVRKR